MPTLMGEYYIWTLEQIFQNIKHFVDYWAFSNVLSRGDRELYRNVQSLLKEGQYSIFGLCPG